jgi:hypothetical protein
MKVSKWPSLVRFACQLIRDEELDLRWDFSARFCLFFRSVSAVYPRPRPKRKTFAKNILISGSLKKENIGI